MPGREGWVWREKVGMYRRRNWSPKPVSETPWGALSQCSPQLCLELGWNGWAFVYSHALILDVGYPRIAVTLEPSWLRRGWQIWATCGWHYQQPAKKPFLDKVQLSGDLESNLTSLHTARKTNLWWLPILKKKRPNSLAYRSSGNSPFFQQRAASPGCSFPSPAAESGPCCSVRPHSLDTPTMLDMLIHSLALAFPSTRGGFGPFEPYKHFLFFQGLTCQ